MNDLPLADAIERQFEVHHWESDEALCRCRWHDDHGRPNLSVNGVTGLYKCWVCDAKGKIGGLSEDEELTVMKAKLRAIEDVQTEFIEVRPEAWLKQFSKHPYWHTARGFSRPTIERFNLGYDPNSNRLTIPVRTIDGKLMGAILRALDQESKPKYLNPKGFRSGHHLFGAHLLNGQERVALVEGPLDAVACWDARVPALATYGARLTEGQAQMLRMLNVSVVVPFFDNDLAGRMASDSIKAIVPDMIIHRGEWLWPTAKDPGELRPDQRRRFWRSAGFTPIPD